MTAMQSPPRSRRTVLRQLCAVGAAAIGSAALAGCASQSSDPKVITYWTTITDPITMKAWHAIIAGFERGESRLQGEPAAEAGARHR